MKNSYLNMMALILILILIVSGIFYFLQTFDYIILANKPQQIKPAIIKNIFITLLENYEKNLLNLKEKNSDEKKMLLEKLNTVKTKKEKNEIENKIMEIDNMQNKFNYDISEVNNEKNSISAEIKIRNDRLNESINENENLKKEIVDLKIYWDSYVNKVRDGFISFNDDQSEKDKINNAFLIDNGSKSIPEFFNDILNKKKPDSPAFNADNNSDENYKKIKNLYDAAVKNLEDICINLNYSNKDLINKINSAENKFDDINYILQIKKISDLSIQDLRSRNSNYSPDSTLLAQKDSQIKNAADTIEKLNSEKISLEQKINEALQNNAKLDNEINDLNKSIKEFKSNSNDRRNEIELLFEITNINGYFIETDKKISLVINEKKRDEILNTAIYNVYDRNKKIVSKIYLTADDKGIIMTKMPGYNTPVSGNWF